MDEKIFAVWLSLALNPGSIYSKRLIEKYGNFSEIYRLGKDEYTAAGIKPDSPAMTCLLDKSTKEAERCINFCECNYFNITEYTSGAYPQRLRAIKDPPAVIYTRGRMTDIDDNVCIAVVGTRSYSDAGWNSTYKIASGLAEGGAVIVTGLASGIDTAATKAALESSGFAVGVLGSGIEKIFPSENKELFERMYDSGLLISELAPFTGITGKYFPVRNRIISGLCNGVLVGEGSTGSGAMITAAHASEQGRHIYAIPADISNPESTGVNKLIRDGATPVFDASDILGKYMYMYPHRIKTTVSSSASVSVPEERSTKRVRVLGTKKAQLKTHITSAPAENTAPKPKSFAGTDTEKTGTAPLVFEKVAGSDMTPAAVPEQGKTADTALMSEAEKKVYEYISGRDFGIIDEIAAAIGEDYTAVSVAVTFLEIKGLVIVEGAKVMKA